MIKVDLVSAVILYLLPGILILFVLWFRYEKSKKFYNLSLDNSNIWQCEICNYTYVNSLHDEISQCPLCESYNQKSEV